MEDRQKLAKDARKLLKEIKKNLKIIESGYSLECKFALKDLAVDTQELSNLFDEYRDNFDY